MESEVYLGGDAIMKKRIKVQEAKSNKQVEIPFILALANKILNILHFVEFINNSVEWDPAQWYVSPGNLAKAVVLATFFDIRSPLSRMSELYMGIDTEYLFGEGVKPENINEYNIAQMLDRLADAKPNKLYGTFCLTAHAVYRIFFKRLHSDTTSLSFYGSYENNDEEKETDDLLGVGDQKEESSIRIEKGYNKDDRHSCKQLVYGKIVNEYGIPIAGFSMDGTTSDVTWNKKVIEHLQDSYKEVISGGIYIADSKMVNAEIVRTLTDPKKPIMFISRCPSNFYGKLENEIIEKAYQADAWVEIGKVGKGKKACDYSTWECEMPFEDRTIRLVAVKSSEGRQRFLSKMDKELKSLTEEVNDVNKKKFACEADAIMEWDRFRKNNKKELFDCKVTYRETKIEKRRRGRPAKDAKPVSVETVWNICIEVTGENGAAVERFRQTEECFVLITNVSKDKLNMREILEHYKGQIVVEKDFKFFKEPCIASVIYLKTPERIKALVMLLGVSLLLRGLIQYKMRKGYQKAIEDNIELPRVGWRSTELQSTLTVNFLMYAFNKSKFIKNGQNSYIYYIEDKMKPRIVTLLQLMDLEVTDLLE